MKMKKRILHGLIVATLFMAVHAQADETYYCTYGQQTRVISIVYENQDAEVPCEVRYRKDGGTEVLWSADSQQGYCESKAQSFVDQHDEWGWRCESTAGQATEENASGTVPDMGEYQQAAAAAQALAVAAAFKTRIAEYYATRGDYPGSLEDLGLERGDMTDSQHVRDLTVQDGGAIYILGNEGMGEDSVLVLEPRVALGGMSNEWACRTNLMLPSLRQCEHDESVTFPD